MDTRQAALFLEASRPVAEVCFGMNDRDYQRIADQMAANAVWTIVGRRDRFPFGGSQGKLQFVEGIKASLPVFETFTFEVESWAKNGDTVFVEAQVHGRGPGLSYSNHYLLRFRVRDGLIIDALEHYDPFEALAFIEQLSAKA